MNETEQRPPLQPPTSKKELLNLCQFEGDDKRGMTTHIDEGAILALVTNGGLGRSSSLFLRKLCKTVVIRNYWCGSTEDLEHCTKTTTDARKKSVRRLKDSNALHIVQKPSKHRDFWLLKIHPVIVWRGFGNRSKENPLRIHLTHKWITESLESLRMPPSATSGTPLHA